MTLWKSLRSAVADAESQRAGAAEDEHDGDCLESGGAAESQ